MLHLVYFASLISFPYLLHIHLILSIWGIKNFPLIILIIFFKFLFFELRFFIRNSLNFFFSQIDLWLGLRASLAGGRETRHFDPKPRFLSSAQIDPQLDLLASWRAGGGISLIR